MTGDPSVPIAIVDDHPLYLSAVVAAFDGVTDIRIVHQCGSFEDLDERLTADPDSVQVVLLDLSLPGRGGADAVAAVVSHGPSVLVLSGTAPPAQLVEVFAAGALGYLTKRAKAEEIVNATRAVAGGGSHLAPELAPLLGEAIRTRRPVIGDITAREREVLALLAAGLTDRLIAQRLSISVTTVRSHLERIRAKTGSHRRADLTRLAIREGITVSSPARL
jgi:DNA-binding NarL/FixJ family response regulator